MSIYESQVIGQVKSKKGAQILGYYTFPLRNRLLNLNMVVTTIFFLKGFMDIFPFLHWNKQSSMATLFE